MGSDKLSQVVEHRRKALGLTQPALAGLAGCSERFIRELESGKPTVRLDKVLAVLEVLGLDLQVTPRGA